LLPTAIFKSTTDAPPHYNWSFAKAGMGEPAAIAAALDELSRHQTCQQTAERFFGLLERGATGGCLIW